MVNGIPVTVNLILAMETGRSRLLGGHGEHRTVCHGGPGVPRVVHPGPVYQGGASRTSVPGLVYKA